MTPEDHSAYLEMQRKLAADLAGENGPEAQRQAVLDEVDAMLEAKLGQLTIAGGEDVQASRHGDVFTISAG